MQLLRPNQAKAKGSKGALGTKCNLNQNWIDQCNATLYFDHKNGNFAFFCCYDLFKIFMP